MDRRADGFTTVTEKAPVRKWRRDGGGLAARLWCSRRLVIGTTLRCFCIGPFKVFEFADKYRGSYNDSIGLGPMNCYGQQFGYTKPQKAQSTGIMSTLNMDNFKPHIEGSISEFGWDAKHAGINVLVSKYVLNKQFGSYHSIPFLCGQLYL
ncbi:endoglucanase 23 [Phtheirospermum japonicum]|uniref:Endoglucanase 23 n=1 Tax=Phtheirospermum japonicum TaxID=374723 RepID=A0A830CEB6_9LAMI|nr:endoglucanase 23 [Phtheirospermum japonicum]